MAVKEREAKNIKDVAYRPQRKKYELNLFIGIQDEEEYYLNSVSWECGWYWGGIYIEGLRPYTEEELREMAENIDPEEFFDKNAVNSIYFDVDKFKEDYADEWAQHSDIVREVNRDKETVYLCFGLHTHADEIFLKETKNYKELKQYFNELAITQKQYGELIDFVRTFYSLKHKCEKLHHKNTPEYLKCCAKLEKLLNQMEIWNNKQIKNAVCIDCEQILPQKEIDNGSCKPCQIGINEMYGKSQ